MGGGGRGRKEVFGGEENGGVMFAVGEDSVAVSVLGSDGGGDVAGDGTGVAVVDVVRGVGEEGGMGDVGVKGVRGFGG